MIYSKMKILLLGITILILLIYTCLYFYQESLLFHPTVLPKDYQYRFPIPFKEVNLKTADNINLNTLLFTTNDSKGVVLFLHGNAGALHQWGLGAEQYINSGWDVFYLDYRGYGKSEGRIFSETQLVKDAQLAYDYLKDLYAESQIIISGTSIGTGIATQIAKNNKPKHLILNSPYSSLKSLIKEKVSIVPSFLIKYHLNTIEHLNKVDCPIAVFHGYDDTLIPVHHAQNLKDKHSKIRLQKLLNCGHNDIPLNRGYQKTLFELLK